MGFWKKSDKEEEKKEDDTRDNNASFHNHDIQENNNNTGIQELNEEVLDVVIIGAGWAGISAGMFGSSP